MVFPIKKISPQLRLVLMWGVPLVFACVGFLFWWFGGQYVETENAYVKADKIPITVEVPGRVVQVLRSENDRVKAGDPLFSIDDSSYLLALEKAQAELEKTSLNLLGVKKSLEIAKKNLKIAEAELAYWIREEERQTHLVPQGYISASKMDDAHHHSEIARLTIAQLLEEIKKIEILLGGALKGTETDHPDYQRALSVLKEAKRQLGLTHVMAPREGTITHLPKLGEYLSPNRMAAIEVAESPVWIEANFNESDMMHVRMGQKVKIQIDTYSGQVWEGEVESVNPATGEEFSLIPPQNASGNWVKIVQRIPVRIRIKPCTRQGEGEIRLRSGMSAWVQINTEHARQWWWG